MYVVIWRDANTIELNWMCRVRMDVWVTSEASGIQFFNFKITILPFKSRYVFVRFEAVSALLNYLLERANIQKDPKPWRVLVWYDSKQMRIGQKWTSAFVNLRKSQTFLDCGSQSLTASGIKLNLLLLVSYADDMKHAPFVHLGPLIIF